VQSLGESGPYLAAPASDGNVVEHTDSLAPQPPGYNFVRDWRYHHGGLANALPTTSRSMDSATSQGIHRSEGSTRGWVSVWESSETSIRARTRHRAGHGGREVAVVAALPDDATDRALVHELGLPKPE